MGCCYWKANHDEKLTVRSEHLSCFGLLSAWAIFQDRFCLFSLVWSTSLETVHLNLWPLLASVLSCFQMVLGVLPSVAEMSTSFCDFSRSLKTFQNEN